MPNCWRPLLTAFFLSSLAAHAQKPLVVETFPPGAKILIADRQYVGLTCQPLDNLPSGTYSLTLRLDHHEPVTVTVSGNDFVKGIYPPQGVIKLPALSFSQAVKDQVTYRAPLLLGLLALATALAYAVRRLLKDRKRQLYLETFQPSEGAQGSLLMERIGEYRVVSTLGQGGMAEVYLAVPNDTLNMGKAVAVKVMSRSLRDRPDLVERFEREIKLGGQLSHPGIVELTDWGWQGERLYLVMEYIEGQALRKLLPELQGDWVKIVDILSQLMLAIDFAHQRGVAHRDLKPENVMITPDGRVKVMDFGLARAVESETLTDIGTALGTPKYIAPETIAGHGADDRADQYTLGVVAYELLTGRPPFEGNAVPFLLYSHSNLEPPAPSTLASLPVEVDLVIARMMAKNPRERFRSVEEARVELLKAMEPLSCPP